MFGPLRSVSVSEMLIAIQKCQQLCDKTWGYAYRPGLPPRRGNGMAAMLQRVTPLDFFACGELVPLTNGETNDNPPGPFGCDCNTDPTFIELLNRFQIDADKFSRLKSENSSSTPTLEWLRGEFVGKGLRHLTTDEFARNVRDLFKKWDIPTSYEEMPAAQYEEHVRDTLGAEEVGVGDVDYWKQMQFYRQSDRDPGEQMQFYRQSDRDPSASLRNLLQNMSKGPKNKVTT